MGGSEGDPKEAQEEEVEIDVEKASDLSKWEEQQKTGNRRLIVVVVGSLILAWFLLTNLSEEHYHRPNGPFDENGLPAGGMPGPMNTAGGLEGGGQGSGVASTGTGPEEGFLPQGQVPETNGDMAGQIGADPAAPVVPPQQQPTDQTVDLHMQQQMVQQPAPEQQVMEQQPQQLPVQNAAAAQAFAPGVEQQVQQPIDSPEAGMDGMAQPQAQGAAAAGTDGPVPDGPGVEALPEELPMDPVARDVQWKTNFATKHWRGIVAELSQNQQLWQHSAQQAYHQRKQLVTQARIQQSEDSTREMVMAVLSVCALLGFTYGIYQWYQWQPPFHSIVSFTSNGAGESDITASVRARIAQTAPVKYNDVEVGADKAIKPPEPSKKAMSMAEKIMENKTDLSKCSTDELKAQLERLRATKE